MAKGLFTDILDSVPGPRLKWQLVTNHLNLFFMLAAGMVMGPAGYGKKYYLDPLSTFPGWIPLFPGGLPAAAQDLATSEKSHLIPCILTLDLTHIRGQAIAISSSEGSQTVEFPQGLSGGESAILLPAPLPTSWIESVTLRSKDEKNRFEESSRDFSNLPMKDLKLGVDAKAFARPTDGSWPPVGVIAEKEDQAPGLASAAGGILGVLYHVANRSDYAADLTATAFLGASRTDRPEDDWLSQGLVQWLSFGEVAPSSDTQMNLFWGVIRALTDPKTYHRAIDPLETVLEYLSAVGPNLDDRYRAALSKLHGDLQSLTGLGDSTISELLDRHPKPFSRALILFFLRSKFTELLELKNSRINEQDFLAAAILFGARDGWQGLPTRIKESPGLAQAVIHRMCQLVQTQSGSSVDLGEAPSRPVPLRDYFAPGPRAWTRKKQDAALLLAHEMKWKDCIQTRINLGKGDYRFQIDAGGLQILIPGEVKNVVTEVDPHRLIELLGEQEIPNNILTKLIGLLGGELAR